MRLASFIDVETTGLDPRSDEVVEFAISLFAFSPRSGEILGVVDQYAGLRDPGRPIPKGASAIHGICDADVRGKRLDDRMVRSLISRSEFLVAHNAAFDRPFVERLYPEASGMLWLCSMRGVPWKSLGFPSRGLQNLLKAHGICPGRAHRGLDDVQAALALLATRTQNGTQYFKYVCERYSYSAMGSRSLAIAAGNDPAGNGRHAAPPRDFRAAGGDVAPPDPGSHPAEIGWLRRLLSRSTRRGG